MFYYRYNEGVEVDEIVQLLDGRLSAIEIKHVEAQVNAAANLLRSRQQLELQLIGAPAFLALVLGKGFGYRRPGGISVLPVGALGYRSSVRSLLKNQAQARMA